MAPKPLIAAALVCIAMPLAAAAPASPQTIRSGTAAVVVGVNVTASGRPVRGLTADDFVVRDNGVLQHVQLLTGSQPIDLSIWLDASGSVADPARLWRAAADIAALLHAGDRIEVVLFQYGAREVIPMSPVPMALPEQPAQLSQPGSESMPSFSLTPVFDVVAQALMRPGAGARRHIIAVLTDRDESYSVTSPEQLASIAERSDATLFLVATAPTDVPLMRTPDRIRNATSTALDRAATLTGGKTVKAKQAVAGFRDLLAQVDEQYVLGFSSEGVALTGWHEIKVELVHPNGAVVTARRGYFGG